MTKVIKKTKIGNRIKSFKILSSYIDPDLSFDERIQKHKELSVNHTTRTKSSKKKLNKK